MHLPNYPMGSIATTENRGFKEIALYDCDHDSFHKTIENRWPLELLRGSQAPRRAVCGTRGSLRTMHGQGSPASSSVWREDPGLLSRPCRKRRPSAREDGGQDSCEPWTPAYPSPRTAERRDALASDSPGGKTLPLTAVKPWPQKL